MRASVQCAIYAVRVASRVRSNAYRSGAILRLRDAPRAHVRYATIIIRVGLRMFNDMFYMSLSLPSLHTAMPTPVPNCLNAFWHSDPYIFLHSLGTVFLSCTTVQWFPKRKGVER